MSVCRVEFSEESQGILRCDSVDLHSAFARSTDCDNNRLKSEILHFLHRDCASRLDLDAECTQKVDIFLNFFLGDSEFRDHIARYAAELLVLLENSDFRAFPRKEIRCCHTAGAAADHSRLDSARLLGFQLRKCLVNARAGDCQFGVSDIHLGFVEVSCTCILARMRAEAACHERQRVRVEHDLHRGIEIALLRVCHVGRYVLMDRAVSGTRCKEAVEQRDLLIRLSVRKRLCRLHMMNVSQCRLGQRIQLLNIDSCKWPHDSRKLLRHLRKSLIAAGLQKCCSYSYRPDACPDDLVDIEVIRAAGVGNAQLALEVSGQLCCQINRKSVQGAA